MLVAVLPFLWLAGNIGSAVCDPNATQLHILGLYPMSGAWSGGKVFLLSSQLAVKHINANPDVLPGYEIVIKPLDTKCDGGTATDVMYRELYDTSTTKIMVLGGGCSVVTEPTAQASHHWNLIQLAFASSSSELSNRLLYPRFFRMTPHESVFNVVRLAAMKKFNWNKVATLHQSRDLFSLAVSDFQRDARSSGIDILAAESFVEDPAIQLENIKNVGARIIMGNFYSNMARRVFCAAYHQQMYGAKYVWIIPGWFATGWWRIPDDSIDCTIDQMDEVTAYSFGVAGVYLPVTGSRKPSVAGLTADTYTEALQAFAGDEAEVLEVYSTLGYDSVWSVALALEEVDSQLRDLDPPRTLGDFTYNDSATSEILFDVMSNMQFEGVSGPVQFDSKGNRVGLLQLLQIRGLQTLRVGIVDPTVGAGKELQVKGYPPIVWPGGAPPIDFIIEREDRQTIKQPVFVTGTVFATLGIVLASCFLAFNIRYRKKRVIKMSSPNMNNVMLIGGMLAYVSIICQGVDTAIVSTPTFVWMCKAKTWFLAIGFSAAFGAMFSKTWRVHKIFTRKTVMKMVLKDTRLLSFVAVLIVVDILILTLWNVLDPVTAAEIYGSKVVDTDNDDIVYTPIRMICESRNQTYWIGTFYIINGLLLIFGAFLAWETRKVTIPALNDSKYIGVCVYNILILSLVGAPVSFLLEERNANYALVSTSIWLATTLTLCVVFVPKVRTRNDVQPTKSDVASHSNQPGSSSSESQELKLLRQQLQQLKQNCKCSNLGGVEYVGRATGEPTTSSSTQGSLL
ncbi:gamma-aminobutyric acid type B receptor subunit 1-like isoform X2 [Acanthaster planci]|uniref:Gamma-aminobutyric acid type B receptor subunit 2 n=1 Tax=Acanthaster planci TaxID=133434 RepID=A0A8B7ZPB6_ACAPL|nr:gamma-aminobutyric acid type B receptor subunit 1-like isoform X2 [Acanthaster planci]